MPPLSMAAVRFFLSGLILFAIVRLRGASWPTPKQWRDNAIIGTFLLLGGNGLVAWAEQYVASSVTALIIGIQPVLMVLTEWAWKGGRRPSRLVFVGMFIGFVGVAWLVSPWDKETGSVSPGGVAAVLLACASWAVGSIYSRHVKPAAPPFVASAAQMLTGSVMLGLGALARGELQAIQLDTITARSWWAFAYLVLVGSLIGFSTFVWLMKHSTPARVSTYAYVNPVVAVFLGWLVLHEPISRNIWIGAALIIAAVVIVNTQKGKTTEPVTPAADEDTLPGEPEPARR
jgi:drug/metabolite transporter (DMT)-like permease